VPFCAIAFVKAKERAAGFPFMRSIYASFFIPEDATREHIETV
jgi:hypothetical protein